MEQIITHQQPGDDDGAPPWRQLPPPNWALIDAVLAEMGLLPEPPPPDGAR